MPSSRSATIVRIILAALLMVATLPGRTQGLGLITEPLLADLKVDHLDYANLNFWATLLGSLACLPTGWLLDRCGLRWVTTAIVFLLATIVWRMSAMQGGITLLFAFILLTRTVGQSALSVASITTVGKETDQRSGMMMGIYAVLLSLFFIGAFVGVGAVVSAQGWRTAWSWIAAVLAFGVAPLTALLLRDPPKNSSARSPSVPVDATAGFTLPQALATPAFWVLGLSIALFGLVAAGIGLFNESILAERGFDAETFHHFLGATTGVALLGQMFSGWLSLRWTQTQLLGVAMLLYGIGLGMLPLLSSRAELWIFAGIFGLAGGMITVVFFAVWGQVFGRAHLGRIQGAAQMLTVFASALGPVLFAECHQRTGSYAALLYGLSAIVLIFGVAAWIVKVPRSGEIPFR